MILVKTIVKPSDLHGLGLFADQFIPKDTIIFMEEGTFTNKFTVEEVELLPDVPKQYIKHYGYLKNGIYKVSLDNDKYFNHSENPNTYESDDMENTYTYALRDINIGEELTTNYNDFDYGGKPINHL